MNQRDYIINTYKILQDLSKEGLKDLVKDEDPSKYHLHLFRKGLMMTASADSHLCLFVDPIYQIFLTPISAVHESFDYFDLCCRICESDSNLLMKEMEILPQTYFKTGGKEVYRLRPIDGANPVYVDKKLLDKLLSYIRKGEQYYLYHQSGHPYIIVVADGGYLVGFILEMRINL